MTYLFNTWKIFVLLILAFLPSLCFSQTSTGKLHEFLFPDEALELADQKIHKTLEELSFDETLHPAHTDPATGLWEIRTRNEWTSGYFAGMLWYMYQLTGKEEWKNYAEKWTSDMESTAGATNDHDVGLRIYGSFGKGFMLTENRMYLHPIIQGANSLASRFNPAVGAIKSWEPWPALNANYPVIIDNMMNIELLFLATEYSGREDWKQIAIQHARTTHREHFRSDGSIYHIVDFDDQGNVNRKFTTQGYGPNSAWARGQGWAIYGFAMAYRYTGLQEFLEASEMAANYFISHLPADKVPWYDFLDPAIPNVTKDASAASLAASGMLELYSFTNDSLYFNSSVDILNSLMSAYSSTDTNDSSILRRSTIHRGDQERGTIYADYYFLEAISRYKKLTGGFFPEIQKETTFYLEQNFPNPFNNQTHFYYSVEESGNLQINLFNIAGKKIRTLFNGRKEPGSYLMQLDTSGLSSGLYIYTLQMKGNIESRKMLLIK